MPGQMDTLGDLIKDVELAEFFGVAVPTARSWMRFQMGGFKVGRYWYITKDQLLTHFARKSEEACQNVSNSKGTISEPDRQTGSGKSSGTSLVGVKTATEANLQARQILKRQK